MSEPVILVDPLPRTLDLIMEPPVRVSAMAGGGKLLDGVRAQLDALARRVDVAVTATGD